MARSASCHRDARDAGSSGGSRVVVVSRKSSGTAETDPREKKRDKKKKTPIAGRMWDSFESESPSEEEEDGQETPPLKQQPSRTTSRSANSTTSERRDRRRARKDRSESGRSKGEIEKKGKRSGSYGSGSQSAGSSTNNRKSSRSTIRVGDKVVAYLPSGGKAKGTVSAESSRDRYEVTLENGDVEKRVHSRNIALARRHRHNKLRNRDKEDSRKTSSSRSQQQKKKGSLRPQESRHEALDRQDSVHEALGCQDSIYDALLSESGSPTPRDHHSGSSSPRDQNHDRSSVSSGVVVGSSPPSSSAEAQKENTVVGGDGPSSPVSQGLSATTSAASGGGGDPALQPPEVESHSPDTAAPNRGQTLAPIEASVSESEADTSNGERGSPPERRSSSPLSSKVRQAQGLLKTMFWKKGEEQGGGSRTQRERSNSASRRWPRGNSISRRFSKGSDGLGAKESPRSAHAHPGEEDEGEGIIIDKLDPPTPTSERSGDAASTLLGAAALKGHARRVSQGLTRGRSRSRKKSEAGPSGASESAASRSPSLAAKLGMTLRGAVMGTTQLGVHKPHVDQHTRAADMKSPSSAGSDADGASDATYSTGASTKEKKLSRRERRGSRRKPSAEGRAEDHGGHSSDGFDSDIFGQDSPLAPATYGGGGPRNFPDAVHSYIGARERMEHEMSASGPAFLPCVDSLAANNSEGDGAIKGWGKRRGSLDITKEASSTTQRTEQHQPFTEAMFKAGISETKHSTKQGILLEGDLQKFSPESMRGVRWHKRYFVLYACSCELRYYRTHAEAAWGRIPLGERGSIPLRLVVKIEQPSDKKYRGCRFDLVVLHKGDSRHPGLNIRPGQESRVFTTKTFKFNAADAQQRLLWVTVIEALMKKHSWGGDADRCRGTGAPRHGGPGADTGDSLCWGSTWDGQAAGTEPPTRRQETGRLDNGRIINTGALEEEFSSPRTTGLGHHGLREGTTGENLAARKGSVKMNFVEEQDDRNLSLRQHDNVAFTLPAQQQRGLRMPYSLGGKRGSLTTGALSPPVLSSGGARRPSSLKSDLRL